MNNEIADNSSQFVGWRTGRVIGVSGAYARQCGSMGLFNSTNEWMRKDTCVGRPSNPLPPQLGPHGTPYIVLRKMTPRRPYVHSWNCIFRISQKSPFMNRNIFLKQDILLPHPEAGRRAIYYLTFGFPSGQLVNRNDNKGCWSRPKQLFHGNIECVTLGVIVGFTLC